MEIGDNMRLKIISLIAIIMVMGLVSSYDDIGTYRRNTDLNLNLGCSINSTYCPNTFTCNVTIYNQNGIIINNLAMGNALYPQYNYTIPASNLSTTGLYYGRQVCCSSSGSCADYSFSFNVNAQGKEYNSIEGSIYFVLLFILVLTLGFSLYGSIKIPYKNHKTPDGTLYKINWQKYLKLFLFAIAYTSFIGITYFAWNISYGVLEFTELAGFFNFLYKTSYILIFPILLFLFVLGLITFVTDKKNQTMLERGLTIK